MQDVLRGFPSYGFSVVVKFGGSLMRDPVICKAALAEIERVTDQGHRILIVPGGGIPDKAIEAIDASHPLESFTAHHACALAQDQTGYLLADRAFSSKLVASSALGECRTLAKNGKVPVLLPSRALFTMDPVEWSWDITSDAVAAWIAWITSTPYLAILTDVDGVYRGAATKDPAALIEQIDAHDLAELGHTSIDACAANFMAKRGVPGVVINGAYPQRLTAWLERKRVTATTITVGISNKMPVQIVASGAA
ncbi:aspartate kinase [Agrobacterium sp. LAD9]|uniref:amino acid kinase family protein n=1 Tax=Agrobacterium sp. LAD9 TaxID=2055153 RepID=UPI000D1D8A81|nr:aspartate kinase [Agrobacterium sp. LAD9]